jgi:YesN/AraC family two-component response regulator
MENAPIIIVEDGLDDCDLIVECLDHLGVTNERVCFKNGVDALNYLQTTTTHPFLILSDVNMPLMNGMELRKTINDCEYLREKSIPFVFLSTTKNRDTVRTAFKLTVQGFFLKPDTISEMESTLREIVSYWQNCEHPNKVRNQA